MALENFRTAETADLSIRGARCRPPRGNTAELTLYHYWKKDLYKFTENHHKTIAIHGAKKTGEKT
jgi:hypothetical protein